MIIFNTPTQIIFVNGLSFLESVPHNEFHLMRVRDKDVTVNLFLGPGSDCQSILDVLQAKIQKEAHMPHIVINITKLIKELGLKNGLYDDIN